MVLIDREHTIVSQKPCHIYFKNACRYRVLKENIANYVFNLLKFVEISALKQCSELLPTRAA